MTNLIFTAHPVEMPNTFSEEGGTIWMPWVQGKAMPQKICGMMNVVGYMEKNENSEGQVWRRLHVSGNESYYGKDQFDAFADGRMDNPTLAKIDAAIRAAKKRGGPQKKTARGQRGARPSQAAGRRGVRK
jgi:hypothetical protein